MPFFWEGTDRLREKSELRDEECEFSLMSIEEFASHTDEVSEIDEFFCKFIG